MTDLRALSGLRWSGRGGHVESWFVQAREPSGRRALWVRHVLFSPAPRSARDRAVVPAVAEVWAIAFDREAGHVAVKSTVPLERARFARLRLDVEVDGAQLDARRARGEAASGGRALAWDLAIGEARVAPVVHLPELLYGAKLPTSKLVTPVADAASKGTVRVRRGEGAREETWDVAGWPTVVGHNWGTGQAESYAWSHASAWDVPDLVVEAVCGRVRLGPLPLVAPQLAAIFVRFRGQRFDVGAFEGLGRSVAKVSLRRFEIAARRGAVSIRFEAFAETDELVGLHYADPSGDVRTVLGSAVARARLELVMPGRVVTATSPSSSLEIGTQDPGHGVRMFL